jgi:predicted GTPase
MRSSSLLPRKDSDPRLLDDEEDEDFTSSDESFISELEEDTVLTHATLDLGAQQRLQSQRTTAGELAILVMGVTGSGKSTFINRLTEENVEIGHSLESCSSSLSCSC